MLASTKRKGGPDSSNLNVQSLAWAFLHEIDSETYRTHLKNLEDVYNADVFEHDSDEKESMETLGLNKEEMSNENSFIGRVSNLKIDFLVACEIIKLFLKNDHKADDKDSKALNDFRREVEDATNDTNKRLMSEVLRDQRKKGRFGLDDAFPEE